MPPTILQTVVRLELAASAANANSDMSTLNPGSNNGDNNAGNTGNNNGNSPNPGGG